MRLLLTLNYNQEICLKILRRHRFTDVHTHDKNIKFLPLPWINESSLR